MEFQPDPQKSLILYAHVKFLQKSPQRQLKSKWDRYLRGPRRTILHLHQVGIVCNYAHRGYDPGPLSEVKGRQLNIESKARPQTYSLAIDRFSQNI